MTKRQELYVISLMVALGAFQCLWHWILSHQDSRSNFFLDIYLSYDPRVGKGYAGWFDLMIPAVVVGAIVGYICSSWQLYRLCWAVSLAAALLTALLPIYVAIMRNQQLWWWPTGMSAQFFYLVLKWIEAIAVAGVFAYGGREIALWRK
jgi:hypothetical protein